MFNKAFATTELVTSLAEGGKGRELQVSCGDQNHRHQLHSRAQE